MLGKSFKFIFSFLLLLGMIFSFTQCEKDNQLKLSNLENTPGSNKLKSSCGDDLKSNTVLGLMADPSDDINHRVNQILYHYGSAMKKVLKNNNLRCYTEDELIIESGSNGVSIIKLAEGNTDFKNALNAALKQSMSENMIYPRGFENGIESLITDATWDANTYLKSKLRYPPYNYDPVAYFIKPVESCDVSRPPVVLLAQEVDECDDVPGWRGDTEIVMSEAEVNASAEHIIFIGPGQSVYTLAAGEEPSILSDNISELNPNGTIDVNTVTERAGIDIDVDIHQIKNGFRFESNGSSEISGKVILYDVTKMNNNNNILWGFWEDFKKDDRSISSGSIAASEVFNGDRNAFGIPMDIFNSGVSVVHLAAYEHDWYSLQKDIATGSCLSPQGLRHQARMKYNHEFYFTTCGYGSTMFLQMGSTYNVENNKCRFQFKRTN